MSQDSCHSQPSILTDKRGRQVRRRQEKGNCEKTYPLWIRLYEVQKQKKTADILFMGTSLLAKTMKKTKGMFVTSALWFSRCSLCLPPLWREHTSPPHWGWAWPWLVSASSELVDMTWAVPEMCLCSLSGSHVSLSCPEKNKPLIDSDPSRMRDTWSRPGSGLQLGARPSQPTIWSWAAPPSPA